MKKPKCAPQGESESLLDNLYLAAPCPMTWESMEGDDRVRHCKGCAKNVYNVSAMTRKEAEEFLRVNGDSPCMQFFRRADGTIMTDNCPVGLRKLRDRVKAIARVAAGFAAFMLSMPLALAQSISSGTAQGSGASQGSGTGASGGGGTTGGGKQEKPALRPLGGAPMLKPPVRGRVMAVPPNQQKGINEIKPHGTTGDKPTAIKGGQTTGTTGTTGAVDSTGSDANKSWIKLKAEHESLADTKAVEFYKKAKEKEQAKNYDLAEFFYEKALDAVEKQGGCDSKFRSLIEGNLKSVRKLKSK